VRGQVRALQLGGMSPSWKAATRRRTPNYDTTIFQAALNFGKMKAQERTQKQLAIAGGVVSI
jgi:hypothetical protein